jgi:hypothetical protein
MSECAEKPQVIPASVADAWAAMYIDVSATLDDAKVAARQTIARPAVKVTRTP